MLADSPAVLGLRSRQALGRRRALSPCLWFCLHVGLQGVAMAAPAAAWEGAVAPVELDPFITPSGLWLGLRGGFSRAGEERQRSFAVLELVVGFDALSGAGPSGHSVTDAPEGLFDAAGAPEAAPPVVTTALHTRCTDGQPCGVPQSFDESPALARAAVTAALRVLGSGAELRRLDSMATRSRASASLPEVRLGAGTSRDESLRLTPTLADPARFTRDGGRDLWFEARLAWRLDGALFSKEEIAIERLKAEHRQERARVTREVLEALLDWQRAGVALRTEHLLPEERDAALVKGLAAVARLDIATGGWFARYLARRRDSATRGPWP